MPSVGQVYEDALGSLKVARERRREIALITAFSRDEPDKVEGFLRADFEEARQAPCARVENARRALARATLFLAATRPITKYYTPFAQYRAEFQRGSQTVEQIVRIAAAR